MEVPKKNGTGKREKSAVQVEIENKVEAFMAEQEMAAAGDKILVAVSGGADSMCLLHLLNKRKKNWDLQLRVVHVNHQLRAGEAERDADFVEAYCRGRSLNYCCRRVDVKGLARAEGLSEEEAARILRYQVLEEEAIRWEKEDRQDRVKDGAWGRGDKRDKALDEVGERVDRQDKVLDEVWEKVDKQDKVMDEAGKSRGGGVKIAIAHHRDDQAETVLFHLFRGSGLRGLGGIPAVRGRIIRPLLPVGRQEILAYLREEGVDFCQDSTNLSGEYTRNRLRLNILPMIEETVNGRAAEHIVQAARRVRQADAYLEKQAKEWLGQFGVERKGMEKPWGIGADAGQLVKEDEIIQTYVIRRMIGLASGSEKDVTGSHVEAVRALLGKAVGKQVDLPYGLWARRSYHRIWLERKEKGENPDDFFLPEVEMKVFSYEKGMEIPQNQYTKWLDCDKIKGALSVRTRQTGDYFFLPGGGRKSIKSYMVDEKIPARLRDRVPLLADGNHILWIIGRRISEGCKVTDRTKKILQVHVRGAEGNGTDLGSEGLGSGCQD